MIDLATRKQDWNKLCREVWGPRDYLEEHKKSTRRENRRSKRKWRQNTGEREDRRRGYMEVDMVGQ